MMITWLRWPLLGVALLCGVLLIKLRVWPGYWSISDEHHFRSMTIEEEIIAPVFQEDALGDVSGADLATSDAELLPQGDYDGPEIIIDKPSGTSITRMDTSGAMDVRNDSKVMSVVTTTSSSEKKETNNNTSVNASGTSRMTQDQQNPPQRNKLPETTSLDPKWMPRMNTLAKCAHCCEQETRLAAIRRFCDNHPDYKNVYVYDPRNPKHPLSNIRVHLNTNVLVCTNMKAGSRFWNNALVKASNPLPNVDIYNWQELKDNGVLSLPYLNENELKRVLNASFKVVTVRHPIERVLSAYRDKFVYSIMGEGSVAAYNYVLRKYRNAPIPPQHRQVFIRGQPKITLTEFVRLVVDDKSPYNIHWQTFSQSCHPCAIAYDHVIKTETTQFDSSRVLDILSRDQRQQIEMAIFGSRDADALRMTSTNQTFFKILEEFREVPQKLLYELVLHFQEDMEMFGYHFDILSLKASCASANSATSRSCC